VRRSRPACASPRSRTASATAAAAGCAGCRAMGEERKRARPASAAEVAASLPKAPPGVRLPAAGVVLCDVCRGTYDIEEAWAGLDLCPAHAEALEVRLLVEALRSVIPPDVQDARPSDLGADLGAWQPSDGGLYLFGPVGTGKSHAAAALLK